MLPHPCMFLHILVCSLCRDLHEMTSANVVHYFILGNFLYYRTFTVPSANFPGQNHTWRLSPFLQKGSEPTMDTLRRTIAWSVALLRLTAAERISGDVFSLRRSAQSLRSGLRSLLGELHDSIEFADI